MSSIFNLFGGTGGGTRAAKQQSSFGPTESSIKSTIFDNARPVPGKNALLTPAKPKGLSIRSKSEINVLRPTGNGERSPRKKSPNKALAKAYLGGSDCVSLPVSPRNKSSKLETIKSKQQKALSSKSKSPVQQPANEKQQSNEAIFKKPSAVIHSSKRAGDHYPKDVLAFHYDDRTAFDCTIDNVDREFAEFMKVNKVLVQPYEDEGFASDPELTPTPISNMNMSDDDFPVENDSIGLPELSYEDEFLLN